MAIHLHVFLLYYTKHFLQKKSLNSLWMHIAFLFLTFNIQFLTFFVRYFFLYSLWKKSNSAVYLCLSLKKSPKHRWPCVCENHTCFDWKINIKTVCKKRTKTKTLEKSVFGCKSGSAQELKLFFFFKYEWILSDFFCFIQQT